MLSIGVSANTVQSTFNKHSILPADLKVRVLKYVTEHCRDIVSDYGLSEVKTEIEFKMPDRGMTDTYFKTVLNSRYYSDGMHPANVFISVETVEYDSPAYGKDYDIVSVHDDNQRCN